MAKIWKRIAARPAIVVLVLSLILIVLNLYLTQRGRPYTSDDISWQNILTTWTPFNGHIVDMGGEDNFLVNVPLLMIMGHLFHASRTILFIEASIFAITNFVLFYFAGLYFLRKSNLKISFETLLPFLWISSLGYNFSQLFLNAAWRDFEMGVSFIYFVLAVKLYYGEIDPFKSWATRSLAILTSVVAGIFIYSDPYFLYLTVAPIAVLFIVLFLAKRVSKAKLALVLGSTVFSFVIVRILKSAVARIGLFSPRAVPVSFVSLSQLINEVSKSLDEMTTIFGVNISGVRLFSMVGIASILSLAIMLIIGIWFVVFVVKHRDWVRKNSSRPPSPLILLSSLFGALVILVFVATVANDEDNYRYFVISVYLIAVLASFVVATTKRKSIYFVVLLWLAICVNLATSVFANTPLQQQAIASGNNANAANYAFIQELKQLGLNKGYGNYWNGNINTYLSDDTVNVLPVTCINNETVTLRLLVDSTQFQLPSSRSFYISDPSQTSPAMCGLREVEGQFGEPSEIVNFQKKAILIYNYDIVTKMQ